MATPHKPAEDLRLELRVEAGEQKDFLRKKSGPSYDRRDYLDRQLNQFADVCVDNLLIGDYGVVIRDDSQPREDWKLVALIERKNYDDMVSSVTSDDRYISQSQRMDATGCNLLYWLIVGGPSARTTEQQKKAVGSALDHLSAFPKFKVIRVDNNEADTVLWLGHTLKYLHMHLTCAKGGLATDLPLWRVAMEKGRRPQLDSQPVCWLETLAMPTRVGRETARAVVRAYPSFASLYLECRRVARVRFIVAVTKKRKSTVKGSGAHPDTLDEREQNVIDLRDRLADHFSSKLKLASGKAVRRADIVMILATQLTDDDVARLAGNYASDEDQ
jgi:hypothetical protein